MDQILPKIRIFRFGSDWVQLSGIETWWANWWGNGVSCPEKLDGKLYCGNQRQGKENIQKNWRPINRADLKGLNFNGKLMCEAKVLVDSQRDNLFKEQNRSETKFMQR